MNKMTRRQGNLLSPEYGRLRFFQSRSWSPMEKMRHVIVHDYDRVDVGIVWDTVKKDLPSPVPLLERLLEEEGE